MMLWKNRNKRVGLCVMVIAASLALAIIWAVLATPGTALAARPDNPGGNIVKQDIPGKLMLTGSALTSDGLSPWYSNSEAGTTCFIGRRRSIWVNLSKNSSRSMNLTLDLQSNDGFGEIIQGDDPWGVPTDIDPPALPSGAISQVELQIAPYLNVSGLPEGQTLSASTWLLFLDGEGNQWGLYFGRGRNPEPGWGGARFFTDPSPSTLPVEILCNVLNESWTVTSNDTPGYLWYRGSKKNAPWVYVGKCNVPWSCDVEDLL